MPEPERIFKSVASLVHKENNCEKYPKMKELPKTSKQDLPSDTTGVGSFDWYPFLRWSPFYVLYHLCLSPFLKTYYFEWHVKVNDYRKQPNESPFMNRQQQINKQPFILKNKFCIRSWFLFKWRENGNSYFKVKQPLKSVLRKGAHKI